MAVWQGPVLPLYDNARKIHQTALYKIEYTSCQEEVEQGEGSGQETDY